MLRGHGSSANTRSSNGAGQRAAVSARAGGVLTESERSLKLDLMASCSLTKADWSALFTVVKQTAVAVFLWTTAPRRDLPLTMQYGMSILRHRVGSQTTIYSNAAGARGQVGGTVMLPGAVASHQARSLPVGGEMNRALNCCAPRARTAPWASTRKTNHGAGSACTRSVPPNTEVRRLQNPALSCPGSQRNRGRLHWLWVVQHFRSVIKGEPRAARRGGARGLRPEHHAKWRPTEGNPSKAPMWTGHTWGRGQRA